MNEECKIVEEIYTDVERQNFFEYSWKMSFVFYCGTKQTQDKED
jgi:hypothetical protein